jgi:hypothetical protein
MVFSASILPINSRVAQALLTFAEPSQANTAGEKLSNNDRAKIRACLMVYLLFRFLCVALVKLTVSKVLK